MTKGNPFDSKVTKTKFKVLNKSVTGVRGKPQISKSKQQELRRKTILEEYNRRGRSGSFIDRRFGAKNSSLSSEDVMMKRFSRERMRSNEKKQKYNLSNDNVDYDDSLQLTHGGRNLLDIHDMDLEGSDPEPDFGIGTNDSLFLESDEPRSREEIMKEVISKSKSYRSERQRIKEENTAICEELDDEFDSIISSLDKKVQPVKGEKQPKTVQDEYATSIREMAFDSRAKPSNRTPTADEVLERQKKKTETEQKAKHDRMKGIYADDKSLYDDVDAVSDDEDCDAEKSFKRVQKNISSLLHEMESSTSEEVFNKAYKSLVEIAETNSIIQLAKVIRERLLLIGERCNHSLRSKGKSIIMPPKNDLIIFHLIGLIFSTSDYHHLVVSPAKLLLAHLLENGRILEEEHLTSSLFIMQTLLFWEEDRSSQSYSPELLTLLNFFLSKISASSNFETSIFRSDRLISSKINSLLKDLGVEEENHKGMRKIVLEDLLTFKKERILSNLEYIIFKASKQCPSALMGPLLRMGKDIGFTIETEDSVYVSAKRPLLMQKHKPVSLPELMPEFGNSDNVDKEELNIKRLKHQYKRELKSAKRELKKDNSFLNREKWEIKKKSDAEYREKHHQIIGSIANENFENERRKK